MAAPPAAVGTLLFSDLQDSPLFRRCSCLRSPHLRRPACPGSQPRPCYLCRQLLPSQQCCLLRPPISLLPMAHGHTDAQPAGVREDAKSPHCPYAFSSPAVCSKLNELDGNLERLKERASKLTKASKKYRWARLPGSCSDRPQKSW